MVRAFWTSLSLLAALPAQAGFRCLNEWLYMSGNRTPVARFLTAPECEAAVAKSKNDWICVYQDLYEEGDTTPLHQFLTPEECQATVDRPRR